MGYFDWAGWEKAVKPYDPTRPMHRINSPSHSKTATPATGKGFECGCRNPDDGPDDSVFGLIIKKLMRAIPGWVPVKYDNVFQEDQEVEGLLIRSFQTWTDVPVRQWHVWYDWNFHIDPVDGWKHLRGAANKPAEVPADKAAEGYRVVVRRWEDAEAFQGAMECEWDSGTMSAAGGEPGPMFAQFKEAVKDWGWPQAGQMFWGAGRWIYDCGHSTSDSKPVGLMRTELHPVKAFATARWEAHKFRGQPKCVPALKFTFFGSRGGGYRPPETLALQKKNAAGGFETAEDYEFIVDLPKVDPHPPYRDEVVAIGQTPDFPLNTVVLRPDLLLDCQFIGQTASGLPRPEVEFVQPFDAEKPQARVRIPVVSAPALAAAREYGCLLWMGWRDPDNTQAPRVFKCTVKFEKFFKPKLSFSDAHDHTPEEWELKMAVNGRWFRFYRESIHDNTEPAFVFNEVVLFLSEDDTIDISCHGTEEDLVGDYMDRSPGDRTLTTDNGGVILWERDVDTAREERQASPGRAAALKQRSWDVCYAVGGDMWWTVGDQNDPLGQIDPHQTPSASSPQAGVLKHPIPVKDLPLDTKIEANFEAYLTNELGESAELAENPGKLDYRLTVSIKRELQP